MNLTSTSSTANCGENFSASAVSSRPPLPPPVSTAYCIHHRVASPDPESASNIQPRMGEVAD